MASALTAASVRAALAARATSARAASNARFFRSGPGDYGEGDRFVGVDVPGQRAVARAHRGLPLPEISALLDSPLHEERLTALLVLVDHYQQGDAAARKAALDLFLARLDRVNNWDLVDSSAPQLLGHSLLERPARERRILDRLAASSSLWERRVAMVATQALLRGGQHEDTVRIAAKLLGDPHDLIHKAVGWMLREMGKYCDEALLRAFLREHAARMPRTALRYAIERLPPDERARWMAVPRAR